MQPFTTVFVFHLVFVLFCFSTEGGNRQTTNTRHSTREGKGRAGQGVVDFDEEAAVCGGLKARLEVPCRKKKNCMSGRRRSERNKRCVCLFVCCCEVREMGLVFILTTRKVYRRTICFQNEQSYGYRSRQGGIRNVEMIRT